MSVSKLGGKEYLAYYFCFSPSMKEFKAKSIAGKVLGGGGSEINNIEEFGFLACFSVACSACCLM